MASLATPGAGWPARAGWAVVAIAGATLLVTALAGHPVGDYYTESDFYGGYAAGARLIQQGRIDPSRYAVVGPGYEAALALAGFLARDLFLAARLLSVAAACGTLILWMLILRRRAGAPVGAWAVALAASSPVFIRYGYSATTDMLAAFLVAAAAFALLAGRGRWAPLAAGILTALAALTRYNAVVLVPVALLCYAWLAPHGSMSRRRACALYLAGFAALLGPWLAWSLGTGNVPGASLFKNFGFYANPEAARNVQDRPGALTGAPPAARSLAEVLGRDAGPFLLQTLRNLPDHLWRDGRELLGWPAAALALAGVAFAVFEPGWSSLAPVWALGAVLFVSLAPLFYSDRYSLPLLPVYSALGAVAVASRSFALPLRPPGPALKRVLALLVVVLGVQRTIAYKQGIDRMTPFEVVDAGRALAGVAHPGERVVSRKGHIGYYAGLEVVPFPRFTTLAGLADYCRRERAGYLYYSWYEAQLRPEFCYLLDTSAVVPGLSIVASTERNPSVVYRIGPDFGADPPWFADPLVRRVHESRALAKVLADSLAAPHWILLGGLALDQGRPDEALELAEKATRARPRDALGWSLAGEALRATHRMTEAEQAYRTALALEPRELQSRIGLGWVELALGRPEQAARVWRPVIREVRDPGTLEAMARLFEQLGDGEAARAARAGAAPGAPR